MSLTRTLVSCVATAALAGCAGSGGLLSQCPEPSVAAPDYIIGAGDNLNVFVWRNPEVSTEVQVRPDGRISTPLVEDMMAAGKTPATLARDMESVLSQYLRSPTVNIMVNTPGQGNQIQVVGQIVTPQSVPYRESIRLLDVIVASGGLLEYAAGNRAKVSRRLDGQLIECSVRVEDLMGGDMSQNIRMYPGDVVVIPESRF
jgi:polysaccharide export outer membrane protein